jgi:hypothetical protein
MPPVHLLYAALARELFDQMRKARVVWPSKVSHIQSVGPDIILYRQIDLDDVDFTVGGPAANIGFIGPILIHRERQSGAPRHGQ